MAARDKSSATGESQNAAKLARSYARLLQSRKQAAKAQRSQTAAQSKARAVETARGQRARQCRRGGRCGAREALDRGRDRGGIPPLRSAVSPEPKGELEHVNPFTLLVRRRAVGAGDRRRRQQGDAPRCSPQSTRRRRWLALGEERLRDAIKTIGLYRIKAKNVIALSRAADRRAWRRGAARRASARGAAGRRAQDRERRAQHGVRRADHRGRYARVPRRQPHRPGAGQDAAGGRAEARNAWCRRRSSCTRTTG